MGALIGQLLALCLLRRAPQDLPYSPALTRGLVLAWAGTDLLFLQLLDRGDIAPARVALSLALGLALPWLLLTLRGRRERYAQTVAAFAGSGVLFSLAALPLALRLAGFAPLAEGAEPTPEQGMLGLLWLVLVAWKVGLNGHIWRHALDWPRAGGVLLAIGLFLCHLGLLQALFPVTT